MNRNQVLCLIFLFLTVTLVASCQEEENFSPLNNDDGEDLPGDPYIGEEQDTGIDLNDGQFDGAMVEVEDSLSEHEMGTNEDLVTVEDNTMIETGDGDSIISSDSFQYILVLDRTPDGFAPTHAHGIDLYGIRLVRHDNSTLPAVQVEDCGFGEGDNMAASSCDSVLGEPDGRCLEPSIPDWVSLAGEGGYIIVSFGEGVVFSEGDRIEVFECGAANEVYDVLVGSTADKETTDWVLSCVGVMNTVSCAVPEL